MSSLHTWEEEGEEEEAEEEDIAGCRLRCILPPGSQNPKELSLCGTDTGSHSPKSHTSITGPIPTLLCSH